MLNMKGWVDECPICIFFQYCGFEFSIPSGPCRDHTQPQKQSLTYFSDGAEAQKRYLDSSALAHRIDELIPQTMYAISISAIYGNTEGPEMSISQYTGNLMVFHTVLLEQMIP